jgi:DNA gyrase/topoisomerase IV subunit B
MKRKLPICLLEVGAMEGLFNPHIVSDRAKLMPMLDSLISRLNEDKDVSVLEGVWSYKASDEHKVVFTKHVRNHEIDHVFDFASLHQADFKKLNSMTASLEVLFTGCLNIKLKKKGIGLPTTPIKLYDALLDTSKESMTLQRFKGLGEMNAEQLWETTLNPKNRTLLKVKVEDFDSAEDVFSMLMSNIVEPRKEFIQKHADQVKNIDV